MISGKDRGQKVRLTRDLRRALKRGHPWVFSDALQLPPNLEAGELVTLEHDKRVVGRGYIDPTGPLALRLLTVDPREKVDGALIVRRLERAVALREVMFPESSRTNGYRLVNGEGDQLPGLVVDRYADVLVIKPDGPIAERFWDVDAIAAWLQARTGITQIYGRSRSRGGAVGQDLRGQVSDRVIFEEAGARFAVNVREGQKTGFFLDQREQRIRLGGLAKDKRVLNAFGYTGGFSIHAGLGGARHVVTLDQAGPAIEAAQANWELNGLAPDTHEGVAQDAFAWLEAQVEAKRQFELVILDPPAFAPSRKVLPQALASYRRLTALGAQVTAPGGLLFVASCSAHVPREALLTAVEEGVSEAKRRATLLAHGAQGADHPYPLACSELAYLKTVLLALD